MKSKQFPKFICFWDFFHFFKWNAKYECVIWLTSIIIIIDNVEEGELKEEKNVFYRKNSFNTENKADESVLKKKPIMFIPKAIVLITSPGIHCTCANMRKLLKYGDLPVYSFDRHKKTTHYKQKCFWNRKKWIYNDFPLKNPLSKKNCDS